MDETTTESEVLLAFQIVQAVQYGQLQQAILLLLHQKPRNCRDLAIALLDTGATVSLQQVEAELQRIERGGLALKTESGGSHE